MKITNNHYNNYPTQYRVSLHLCGIYLLSKKLLKVRDFMFGDIVRNLRNARNLNQVQLAKELGVSKQTISNWENNNILPSIEMLTSIARFFSVSTDYLLELDSRRYIEVTDLSLEEISHIQQLINDIRKSN